MQIFRKIGVHVQKGLGEVVLDPRKPCHGAIVTHGHMDHMVEGALMTPQTRDIMGVRIGSRKGTILEYDTEMEYNGFPVILRDAGHVFGSAMVKLDDFLYTGDFNPEGGVTCGKARPEECDILVVEATYGKPGFVFEPKSEVIEDILSWVETQLESGPVAMSGYEFGKAQEIIGLMNQIDADVITTDPIADIADVYRNHGIPLKYRRYSEVSEEEKGSPHVFVVAKSMLKRPTSPEIEFLRKLGGKTCYASGWCAIYNFERSYDIDAQFPLSDHGDFTSLISFIEDCSPKRVITTHGEAKHLAREVRRRLKIEADALD
ncbi:MAG: MBL fold metallo-hydrolase RNA specificity domain-containing protein [Thermoplasmata archaeon]